MSRWSFILIAAIAVVSFFNGPITGQFRLAKITHPEVCRNECSRDSEHYTSRSGLRDAQADAFARGL